MQYIVYWGPQTT